MDGACTFATASAFDVRNGHPDDYLDISRGGGTQPQDLSRLIQGLNGEGNFTQPWNGVGMNSVRP